MAFDEDEIRRAADIKSWLETKISELEEEIARLKETVLVMDSVLRTTSFRTAADLPEGQQDKEMGEDSRIKAENVEIRRAKDGTVLATAGVRSDRVVITIQEDLKLSASTPPFRSFFINRILEGMKEKDRILASQGKLGDAEIIEYDLDEKSGKLEKITIKNYREQKRLGEIFSTVNWAISRMLEKSK
ncbi:MAG: hypothetical protein ACE5KG_04640 [Nitrososphaerales archaeon]